MIQERSFGLIHVTLLCVPGGRCSQSSVKDKCRDHFMHRDVRQVVANHAQDRRIVFPFHVYRTPNGTFVKADDPRR